MEVLGRITLIGAVAATLGACAPYTERYERCTRNEYVYRVPG